MSSAVDNALVVLSNQLTSTGDGGKATNLSALNLLNGSGIPYWRGTTSAPYNRFETRKSNPWQRFFEELWEVPVKLLTGTTSTGVIFIFPTGTETNGENDINNGMRYTRSIPVDVVGVWLDEGAPDEYEDLVDAMVKDSLQDPTLGNNITFFRWNNLERLRPRGNGLAGARLSFLMDYSIAVP